MKLVKLLSVFFGAAIVGLLVTGAKDDSDQRPPRVDASRWIKISETAGIVSAREITPSQQLSGQLYVRTKGGWREVALINNASPQLIDGADTK